MSSSSFRSFVNPKDMNIRCDTNADTTNLLNRGACEVSKSIDDNLTAKTQYENMLTIYNREVIYMVNLLVGLGVGLYYLYTNRPGQLLSQNNPIVGAVKQNIVPLKK